MAQSSFSGSGVRGMREEHTRGAQSFRAVYDAWQQVSELFGYREYFPPFLEPLALYKAHTSEEILNDQMYAFKDKGGKMVALRPELTPTVSRMIRALKQEKMFKAPVRWYAIADLFRYEKPQRGRRRQFTQWNADIFGVSEVWAEAEIIQLMVAALRALGFKQDEYRVRVNDKRSVESLLHAFSARKVDVKHICALLDRRTKMSEREFEKALAAYHINVREYDAAVSEVPPSVEALYRQLPASIPMVYDPEVVRGFNYYTGIVFEVFSTDEENTRSLAGGGRYDSLAGVGGEYTPAVGFGMGDEVLRDLFVKKERSLRPIPVCFVTVKKDGTEKQALDEVARLRSALSVSAAYCPAKTASDVFKRAEREEVPFVAVCGAAGVVYRDIRKLKTKRTLSMNDVKKYL